MAEQTKRYRAFVSYSQKDKAHARRLHQALERYRLPKGVEAAGVDAKTRKLGRFFRDDEEMGAATDLGAALQGAIADADNLIVVCSPNAAQSKWVNEEIIHFKRTARADNIFAVVVAGTPNSDDEHECFPPALRFALGTDGALSDQRAEPLAVDLRKERFARVLTRLVAGLVRTPFDALWRREQRRATAQMATLSLAVFFIALIVGGALTQGLWYPRVDAYWRYARHAHSTEELMAAAPGTTFQDCREGSIDCPVMVVIPDGTFLMGDAPAQTTNEQGQVATAPDERRRISIARFAVSQHEVTFNDWQACAAGGGCRGMPVPSDEAWGRETRPVINVSWEDAQDYARWLSQMTGHDYRLLTEAEWEYAARGVTTTDDPRTRFSWGDEDPVCDAAAENGAASADCERRSTWPVGSFQPNAFGLYDMHGNVWEWVQDCWVRDHARLDNSAVGPHAEASADSDGEASCSERLLRGGSWDNDPEDLRSDRMNSYPVIRYYTFGLRVARTL